MHAVRRAALAALGMAAAMVIGWSAGGSPHPVAFQTPTPTPTPAPPRTFSVPTTQPRTYSAPRTFSAPTQSPPRITAPRTVTVPNTRQPSYQHPNYPRPGPPVGPPTSHVQPTTRPHPPTRPPTSMVRPLPTTTRPVPTTHPTTSPTLVRVPRLSGYSLSLARQVLSQAGLNVGSVSTAPANTSVTGTVVRTNPGAGTAVLPGSQVDLVIASG